MKKYIILLSLGSKDTFLQNIRKCNLEKKLEGVFLEFLELP